jgi:hypothetical protein
MNIYRVNLFTSCASLFNVIDTGSTGPGGEPGIAFQEPRDRDPGLPALPGQHRMWPFGIVNRPGGSVND